MIADGFVEEAVAAARESMGGDNDAQLLYLMGNAYMKQGLRKEAMNAYMRLVEQDNAVAVVGPPISNIGSALRDTAIEKQVPIVGAFIVSSA